MNGKTWASIVDDGIRREHSLGANRDEAMAAIDTYWKFLSYRERSSIEALLDELYPTAQPDLWSDPRWALIVKAYRKCGDHPSQARQARLGH